MLTAFGDPVSVRQGYEAGADDFLQKPADTAALILKVRASLRLKSLHDRAPEEPGGGAGPGSRSRPSPRDRPRLVAVSPSPRTSAGMVTQRAWRASSAPRSAAIAIYDPADRAIDSRPAGVRPRRRRGAPVRATWSSPATKASGASRSGRPYVSNHPRADPRLDPGARAPRRPQIGRPHAHARRGPRARLDRRCNKPGGFSEDDVQLLSIFAGPAGAFLRSRQIFQRESRHAARLERLSALAGQMAAAPGRQTLVDLVTARIAQGPGLRPR